MVGESTKQMYAVLKIYMHGDLRAQGVLKQRSLLFWVLTCVFCIFALTLPYNMAGYYLHESSMQQNLPFMDSVTLLVELLFVLNTLSVGFLSDTAGKEEIYSLRFLPVTLTFYAIIRIFLGLFRGYILGLILLIPAAIAAIRYRDLSIPSAMVSTIIALLIIPLLPACVGIVINTVSEQHKRLVVWFYVFSALLSLTIYLATHRFFLNPIFSSIAHVFALPLLALLGQTTWEDLEVFVLGTLLISVLVLLFFFNALRTWQQSEYSFTQPGSNRLQILLLRQILSRQMPFVRYLSLQLIGLTFARLQNIVLGFVTVLNILGIFYTVQQARLFLPIYSRGSDFKPIILVAGTTILLFASFIPLVVAALGEQKEQKSLQSLPIYPRDLALHVYIVAVAIHAFITIIIVITWSIITHDIVYLWMGMYLIISDLGSGTLAFISVLERQQWRRIIGWNIWLLLFNVIKEVYLVFAVLGTHMLSITPYWIVALSLFIIEASLALILWKEFVPNAYLQYVTENK